MGWTLRSFCLKDPRDEDGFSSNGASEFLSSHKPVENAIVSEKRVFSMRLGKFRSGVGVVVEKGVGVGESSSLDA